MSATNYVETLLKFLSEKKNILSEEKLIQLGIGLSENYSNGLNIDFMALKKLC